MSNSKRNSNQVVGSPASSAGNSEDNSSNAAATTIGNDEHIDKKFKHSQGDEASDEASEGDGEDEEPRKSKRAGRRKIKIEYIEDKSRRHITFSKRKSGIMKKAYELSTLTGTQVLLLVVSETGLVYTFTTPKLQPLVTKSEGKNLIQACLHAPDKDSAPDNNASADAESPETGASEYDERAGTSPQAHDMGSSSQQLSPTQASPQQQSQQPTGGYPTSTSMSLPTYPPPYNHIPFPAQYNYPNMGMPYQNAPPTSGAPHPSYGGGQYWTGPPVHHQQTSPTSAPLSKGGRRVGN